MDQSVSPTWKTTSDVLKYFSYQQKDIYETRKNISPSPKCYISTYTTNTDGQVAACYSPWFINQAAM